MLRNVRDGLRHRQRGVILVWMAVFMLILLSFVALGLDGAKLMATRSQLQNAADAAALGGAGGIQSSNGALIQGLVNDRAARVGLANKAFENTVTPVVIDTVNDVFIDYTARTVRVIARRQGTTSMVAHFAQVVGLPKLEVRAEATAKVTQPCTTCILVPFGVPTQAVTPLIPGNEYNLTAGTGGSQYQYLDFAGKYPCPQDFCSQAGGGASEFQCAIENGFQCCASKGDCIDVKPGLTVSAIRNGIQYRIDNDVDHTQYFANNSYSTYLAAGGNGLRVIVVPLVTYTGGSGGNNKGCIDDFAVFFIKRPYNQGSTSVPGEFINKIVVGSGSCTGPGTAYVTTLIK